MSWLKDTLGIGGGNVTSNIGQGLSNIGTGLGQGVGGILNGILPSITNTAGSLLGTSQEVEEIKKPDESYSRTKIYAIVGIAVLVITLGVIVVVISKKNKE